MQYICKTLCMNINEPNVGENGHVKLKSMCLALNFRCDPCDSSLINFFFALLQQLLLQFPTARRDHSSSRLV